MSIVRNPTESWREYREWAALYDWIAGLDLSPTEIRRVLEEHLEGRESATTIPIHQLGQLMAELGNSKR